MVSDKLSPADLAFVIRQHLLGVAPEDQDIVLGDEDWETILSALALLPQSPQEGMGLPRLDEGLIEAAYRAHYGQAGNPTGTDLTVNGRNWTFAEGFRRMWSGVRKEIKRRAASSHSQEQENGDE